MLTLFARDQEEFAQDAYLALFEHLLNAVAYCAVHFDGNRACDFTVLAVNQAFGTLTGRGDAVGRRATELFPDLATRDAELLERFGRVARGAPAERFELHLRAIDQWLDMSIYAPRQGHVVAVFEVISERVRVAAALAASEARLRLAVDAAHLVTWHWDCASDLLTLDERIAELFDLPADLPSRLPHARLKACMLAEDLPRIEATITAALAAAGLYEVEFRVRWRDGSVHWVCSRGTARRGADGRAASVQGVTWDIDARKRAEDDLRAAEQRAQAERERLQAQFLQAQKMEALGQLAGGIAHDFNNMLTGILGYGKLALGNGELVYGGKIESYLREVVGAAERAAGLVERLQVFSRPRKPEELRFPHPPRALVEDVLRLLRAAIPVSVQFDAVLEDTPALGIEPMDLHQVLSNLAINASDAILEGRGQGTLSLRLRAPRTLRGRCEVCCGEFAGEYLELAVGDDGVGIAPEHRHAIFNPFFTTKEIGKGTGLGLALVQGVVHAVGGHLEVESGVGVGTTVKVFLPATAPR